MTVTPLLAVIPARGGSKGLPGKNIRPLAGLPLIAHSILCAAMCSAIDRLIVSTDSPEIAAVAKSYGADVPFLRPAELASDGASMLSVLKHAIAEVERIDGRRYESLLLLDPTSPARLSSDVETCIRRLEKDEAADGIVGVSQPDFNPYWHCMVESGGYMTPLITGAERFTRRQDAPPVFRINGSVYLFRRDFLMATNDSWMKGRHLMHEIPESRAMSIDTLEEFERADVLIRSGLIELPWLEKDE